MRVIKPFMFAVLAGLPLTALPALAATTDSTTTTTTSPSGKVYSETANGVSTPNSQQPAVGTGRADPGATGGAEGSGNGGGGAGSGGSK